MNLVCKCLLCPFCGENFRCPQHGNSYLYTGQHAYHFLLFTLNTGYEPKVPLAAINHEKKLLEETFMKSESKSHRSSEEQHIPLPPSEQRQWMCNMTKVLYLGGEMACSLSSPTSEKRTQRATDAPAQSAIRHTRDTHQMLCDKCVHTSFLAA